MAPEIALAGKHVFIAGGCRGIGAASANVSLTFQKSWDQADALLEKITAGGGQAQALPMAMEDAQSVMDAVDAAVERCGDLHGMVVAAGIFEHCPIEQMSPEFWRRTPYRSTSTARSGACRRWPPAICSATWPASSPTRSTPPTAAWRCGAERSK